MPTYDVIIIGLGAMGSAALYQLAARGVPVLGLDQYEPPHQLGSTHGETRITRLAVGEGPAYIPLVRRSHEIWRALEQKGDVTLLHQGGGYIINPRDGGAGFHGPGDFALKTANLARAHAIEHELLTSAALRARLPLLQIQAHEHGCFEPTGGVIHPERGVATQLRLARQAGAAIRVNEKVLRYEADAAGVTVITDQGRYSTARVILAAGAWLGDLLRAPWRQRFTVTRQVFFWFVPENEADYALERFPWIIWIGTELADYYSVFPIAPGTRRAVKMVTEQYFETTHPEQVSRQVSEAEIGHMRDHFIAKRLRGMTGRCVEARVCLYTMTSDHDFIIDWHPEQPNVLIASPCSGHGFKHSAAIGEAIAELVSTGTSSIDLSFFALSRLG